MNMKPQKVLIGGRKFMILEPKEPSDALFGHTRLPVRGCGVIQIHRDSNPRRKASTLFHELLHAFSFAYNYKLSENQVLQTERAFAAFCARHPRIVRKIVKELSK